MTTPETLGVDPVSLSGFGNEMLSAAGDIPLAPPPFTTAGADPISLKIMSALPGIETPIQTGLPEIKAEATKTASDIVDAAAKYLQTDEQLAKAYENQQFDGQGGSPGGGGASGGGVPGAGAPGAGAAAGAQAAGGAGGMDQMGQLMSMPMQMAGQAAQIPMQAMGALGSIPQGVMQGVQQVSQMAGGLGGEDSSPGESSTRPDDPSKSESGQDGAALARDDAERAPVEQARPEAREEPPTPAEEKKTPAQTRPAEVAQRMNL
ncbi:MULTISPECIES: hypothetical protein [unclassified Mycobacterium]|uniref:hypothetical protein n=1 Tax=unclassified Mycobacterium TaxID=2642494 RepID=UPI0029C6A103|nr:MULTISPECIES: hypothetical protein [unclassified Mycobacterium]